MTHDEIMQALKDWLAAEVLGSNPAITVIEANQNTPRPARPYITLLVTSTPLSEHPNVSAPNSVGDASIENEAAVMVSLQCFGDNSKSIMDGIRMSLEKVSVRLALRADCLAYIRTTNGVMDTTATVGTKFEPRASMDLEFRSVSAVIDNIGVIESVEITGEFDTGIDEALITNYTVEV